MKKKTKAKCYRNVGDSVAGDQIRVECRKPGDWNLFKMSGQHNGWKCTAKKNAKATVLRSYTNIKN